MTGKISRFLAVAGAVLGLSPAFAQAQGTTISGQVTGTGGTPVVGASVSIPTLRVGGFTDDAGRYSFTVPASANGTTVTVVGRRLGYTPSSAQITLTGAPVVQNYSLSSAATELQGVVVTALGLTREKSQLGTAQQQLSTTEINQTRTLNVINNLQGKVSGVSITGSGTQGGSNRIVFRGANSINGNNSPVFVLDGVAMSNRSRPGDPGGAWDFGSAISDINPDDIATMSILKGPNAAALYGSRAANGVIVMTTKKGSSGKMRTEINSTYTWESPSILPTYQNLYGQGSGGTFQYVDGQGGGDCDNCDQSYGPRLDGRLIDQFTGKQQPWIAHPDNVKSFFNTGHTRSTTVAVSGGTDRANARLSFGSDNVDGYIPNNNFHKTNGLMNASLQINDRWTTDASLQYIRNAAANRPGVGYTQGVLEQFVWFGRQIDMEALRNYKQFSGATNGGPPDREFNWNYNYHNNPFWLQFDNPLNDTRDRFVGNVSATYKLFEGVNARLSTGSDIYRFNIAQLFAPGDVRQNTLVDPAYAGAFRYINDYSNENSTNLIVTASRGLGSRIQFNGTAGGTIRREQFNTTTTETGGITVPGIYNVSNAAITPTLAQTLNLRQVNSSFGSAAFTFDNWWTVEGTARNDWSSTLPKGKNSYFYPSVNTSVVVTDALPGIKGRILSYAKLRASTAKVGNDADPYQLRTTYTGLSTKFGSLPQFTLGDALANADLLPEITHSDEFGAELSFLDGRITFDGSVYSKYTRNQIFNAPISAASGFTSKAINAGRITNKGVEALLGFTPIQADNGFTWNTSFNYGRNKSMVTELAPGVTTILLGSEWNGRIEARLGEPYGAIYGKGFKRNAQGVLLLDTKGRPQATAKPDVHFGNIQPKWTGGWGNTITYKNMTLYGLLDFRRGGNLYSITNMFGDNTGIFPRTLRGRETDWNNPGIVVDGIIEATGLQNTKVITSETYFQRIYPSIEPYVYDASYTKLRELRFGIDLPQEFVSHFNASAVNLALTGRNLKTWTKVPNIDPEFSYTTGNYQGIEFAALPNARVWGLSLRITP